MPRIAFQLDSPVLADRIIAATTDFSERRPELWPLIDPTVYCVHGVGDGWANVTEGSPILGGIWARERYDWSEPGVVRATIQDSNVYRPGGTWELRAEAVPGGSHVSVVNDRRPRGLRGHVLAAMLRLMGSRELPRTLGLTLSRLESSPQSARIDSAEVPS
jgi:hypothetical protein